LLIRYKSEQNPYQDTTVKVIMKGPSSSIQDNRV
jgi:hypothetical protein